jgi:putative DNA primase/helicase
MLAVVRNPQGRPVAIHRTYLENGKKASVSAPKKIMKVHDLTGSAVRLFPPREGFLAACEGIEDALSAWILWQIPAWAVLGASGVKAFQPPEDVKEILILSDNDEPGKKAALELAGRLEAMKKAVRIVTPSGQKDVNGLLMKGSVK